MRARKYAIERFRMDVWHRLDGDWDTWEAADRHIDRLKEFGVGRLYRIVPVIQSEAA
jgi:hypothetical protein